MKTSAMNERTIELKQKGKWNMLMKTLFNDKKEELKRLQSSSEEDGADEVWTNNLGQMKTKWI